MNDLVTADVSGVQPTSRYLQKRAIIGWLARGVLFTAAFTSVAITFGIVYLLVSESLTFFAHVSLVEFLTGTQWTPLFFDPQYGILPLVSGTLVIAVISLSVAVPGGTIVALYLSEFAPHRMREVVKPFLEVLEGVPTVVYGYFALLVVTPVLQTFISGLWGFNMLAPGLVMGIMILPFIASVSEDAMRAVPRDLREGAYAMGATRLQVAVRVILPAAFSGVAAAYILGMSRAVGETMVVAIAAGLQPSLTLNPLLPAATITAYIVQVSLGDLPRGSIGYQTIFAAGLTLFLITLTFNLIGFFLRKRVREVYE
jgi:phosphate transport system permease protein